MHAIFIPYGKRELVERMLRDMEAQKHLLPMTKGKEKKEIWIDSQVRILPFGVMEYVFPKEDLDVVLNTLKFKNKAPYNIPGLYLDMTRKILKSKKIPEYKEDKIYVWRKEHVAIIPIGIREDREIVGSAELDKGWTHEAI